jgi:hypothetical protein
MSSTWYHTLGYLWVARTLPRCSSLEELWDIIQPLQSLSYVGLLDPINLAYGQYIIKPACERTAWLQRRSSPGARVEEGGNDRPGADVAALRGNRAGGRRELEQGMAWGRGFGDDGALTRGPEAQRVRPTGGAHRLCGFAVNGWRGLGLWARPAKDGKEFWIFV